MVAACSGFGLGAAHGADDPVPRGRAAALSPGSGREEYLLLTDGRLIRGLISRDDAGYKVTRDVGVIRCPKRQVEGVFESVEAVYRYRLERAPEDDPAERLRLARWCLSQHLDKEARTLLEQVVELSPDHGPARAMLTSMVQSEAARVARREMKVDEGVRQTGGEAVTEDRPGALDSAVLRGAGRGMGISGLPVIFDLPPALAVRRAEQFKQYVHPVLQAYCARCHNPSYDGPFQLVPVRSAREKTPDAMRANLDATLRLVDRENPEKSELLSSTLRPHGIGGKGRPIFSGSNDRYYQVLAAWVASLRPKATAEPSSASRRPSDPGDGFAVDRNRPGSEPLDELARRTQMGDSRSSPAMRNPEAIGAGGRAYRYVEGQGMVPEESRQPDPKEFPLPYMLGGPRPTVPGGAAARDNGRSRSPADRADADPGTPRTPGPDRADHSAPADVSGATVPAPPASRAGGTSNGPSAAKKTPVKIDPRILERFLQRSASRPDGQ